MKPNGLVLLGLAWTSLFSISVSGACYQLTNIGKGCDLVPVTAPECVISESTNLPLHGTTTSGTGAGMTETDCPMTTVCKQIIGNLDGSGHCVVYVPTVTKADDAATCSLKGDPCVMAGQ